MFRQSYGLLLAALLANSLPLAAEQLRDPTQPLGYQSGTSEERLQLNSILIAEGRRIAVINGQRVGERERIGDVYVLRILPNRVIVSRNGSEVELKLHSNFTRKDAS